MIPRRSTARTGRGRSRRRTAAGFAAWMALGASLALAAAVGAQEPEAREVPPTSPPQPSTQRAQPGSELPASPASPPRPGSPLVHGLELGAGLGWYDGDLGRSDGQFVRYRLSRIYDFGLTLDLGRQHRFRETSYGGGVSLSKTLAGGSSLIVGWGSGTGDVLAPRYRVDAGITLPVRGVTVSAGYTRVQSKAENFSDGYSLGLLRYFPHWIVGASVRRDLGFPGRTISTSVGVSVTRYVWKKTYIGGGLDWGDVSYTLLPGRAVVDYRAVGGNVGFSRWFDERSGINLRFDYGETSFYRAGGLSVSLFREW